jgi:hypothetical protein
MQAHQTRGGGTGGFIFCECQAMAITASIRLVVLCSKRAKGGRAATVGMHIPAHPLISTARD